MLCLLPTGETLGNCRRTQTPRRAPSPAAPPKIWSGASQYFQREPHALTSRQAERKLSTRHGVAVCKSRDTHLLSTSAGPSGARPRRRDSGCEPILPTRRDNPSQAAKAADGTHPPCRPLVAAVWISDTEGRNRQRSMEAVTHAVLGLARTHTGLMLPIVFCWLSASHWPSSPCCSLQPSSWWQ
jgi:hypothetical protein